MGNRGRDYDREVLIEKVMRFRIDGWSTIKLLDFIKEETGLSISNCYKILQESRDEITKITNNDIRKVFDESINQLEKKRDSTTDSKTWLEFQKEINKLQGLHNEKKEVTLKGQLGITGIDVVILSTESESFPDDESNDMDEEE